MHFDICTRILLREYYIIIINDEKKMMNYPQKGIGVFNEKA